VGQLSRKRIFTAIIIITVGVVVLPPTMAKPASMTSISSLSEIIGTSHQSQTTPYIPDFTVRAITDLQYIRIRRAHYMVALHATLLERQRRHAHTDGSSQGAPTTTSDEEEDTFTKEWRRAQRVLSASPSGAARSDAGSIRDDVSVRDIGICNAAADGTGSEVGVGFSPHRRRSGSMSSPQDSSNAVSPSSDGFKHRLESHLFTWAVLHCIPELARPPLRFDVALWRLGCTLKENTFGKQCEWAGFKFPTDDFY